MVREVRQKANEPHPEEQDAPDLRRPVLDLGLPRQKQYHGLRKEIDPSDGHDRIEGEVLVANQEPRDRIEAHFAVVEVGVHGGEELGGDGKERDVLEIGVVLQEIW